MAFLEVPLRVRAGQLVISPSHTGTVHFDFLLQFILTKVRNAGTEGMAYRLYRLLLSGSIPHGGENQLSQVVLWSPHVPPFLNAQRNVCTRKINLRKLESFVRKTLKN